MHFQCHAQLGTQDGGDLAEQIERHVVVLVVLDISDRRCGYRNSELGGHVFTSETLKLAESLDIPADPVSYAYPISVIDGQRIRVTPLRAWDKWLRS